MTRTAKFTSALSLLAAAAWTLGLTNSVSAQQSVKVLYKTVKVGDLDIFYREAGPKDAPWSCCSTAPRPARRCSAT